MMKKRYRKPTIKNNYNQLCINDSSITHEHPTHWCYTQACRWCHRAPRAWHVRCAGSLWASVRETGKWENVAILTRDPNREKVFDGQKHRNPRMVSDIEGSIPVQVSLDIQYLTNQIQKRLCSSQIEPQRQIWTSNHFPKYLTKIGSGIS